MQENPSAGNYQKIKKFGSDVKNRINFGSKYSWKPDSNPPPGLYDTDKSLNHTKPRISTAKLLDKSRRSDFTKMPQRENPSSGTYNTARPFGSECKNPMTFGPKYKWKPDSNPPPGLYSPDTKMTKPSSTLYSPGKSKRTDFTDSPLKENPDAGFYNNHLKKFGSDVKGCTNFGSKYKTKIESNPGPGIYDPHTAFSATLPKSHSTVIKKEEGWKRSNFTESPTRENPDAGYYNNHLKPFGSGLKNPMVKKGDYKWKPNDVPPPGLYDLDASMKHTKPRVSGAVIKDV